MCLPFAALLPPALMPRGQEMQLWGTSSTMLPAAGVAGEGGGAGEMTQPHLLPTHPRSVHRKRYNQINSMRPEENATTVLPALWLLCAFQS